MFAARNAFMTGAKAPVMFRSVATGFTGNGPGTFTHSVPSAANGYLVVFAMHYTGVNPTAVVTADGVSVPAISTNLTWSDGGAYSMQAYGLANPSSGTKSVSVTNAQTSCSVFYSGVNAATVTVTSASAGNSVWVNPVVVTCPPGGFVVHGYGSLYGTNTSTLTGGTVRFNDPSSMTGLSIVDTNVSTSFSGTPNGSSRGFGSIRVFLSP